MNLIEAGHIDTPEIQSLLNQYIQPMLQKNIDALVLGCTHYPYLIPEIKKIIGEDIKIVDSSLAVAKQTKHILEKYSLQNLESVSKPKHLFFSNTDSHILSKLLKNSSVKIIEKKF